MWLILTHLVTLIVGALIGFTAAHILLFLLVLRDGDDDDNDKPTRKPPPPDGEEAARNRAWRALADAMREAQQDDIVAEANLIAHDAFDKPNPN